MTNAQRQAGDIPDPPLSAACSSKAKGGTVFDVVTDKIISLLEQGTAPWRADWVRAAKTPMSLATGKPYRGINHFLLSMISQMSGYPSPYWLTFKQVGERGGKVRKGQKGSPCFFWKVYDAHDSDQNEETTAEGPKRFVARYYTVFNVAQCDGLEFPQPVLPDPRTSGTNPIAEAEKIVGGYHGPSIETKGLRPCYLPLTDTVEMPERSVFFSPEGYYATLFHELVHSTGHGSRLDRDIDQPAPRNMSTRMRQRIS